MAITTKGKEPEHVGRVVYLREANYYDDSDFYAGVWMPDEGRCIEIMYGTTRFACDTGAQRDATPEVMAAYNAWYDREARRSRVMKLWEERKQDWKLARDWRLSGYAAAHRLNAAYCPRRAKWRSEERVLIAASNAVDDLLRVKKFKSEFRASMAAQIRAWAEDPAPKYDVPLSPKQLDCLIRFYR